jgi:hypothetical protein
MDRRTLLAVALALFPAPALAADSPREALALKVEPAGDSAKVTVAFNTVGKPGDRATFQGVRLYTYDVPVGKGPSAVGWKGKDGRQTVVLAGQKHTYFPAEVDRQENGSLVVSKVGEKVRVAGVYHAFGRLFVIDETVKPGDPILLEEAAFDLRDGDGKVLVAADEIAAYDWATHTLTLTPEVTGRLGKVLRDARKLSMPFAASVGGKAVYTGQLTTLLSSQSVDAVVIVVDDPRPAKGAGVRTQLGYPGANFFKGDDPRGDSAIKAALDAAGKLK